MKAVGLRELKNRLSEYIRDVRAGEGILVTDRGQVVAELNPPGHRAAAADATPGLTALMRKGLIRCVRPLVAGLTFPRSGGASVVTYPFQIQ